MLQGPRFQAIAPFSSSIMKKQEFETSHVEEPNNEGSVKKPLSSKSVDELLS
jgi:hypothetical protein